MRSGSSYSTWYNGGLRTMTYFHNMIGMLTETIGSPTPIEVALVPNRQLARGDLPMPGGDRRPWHFRQSIDYSITANRAISTWLRISRRRSSTTYTGWAGTPSKKAARIVGPSHRSGSKRWSRPPAKSARRKPSTRRAATAKRRQTGFCLTAGAANGPLRTVQLRAARPGHARSARLHHSCGPAGFSNGNQVHQRAAQEWHHGAASDGRF